MNVFDLFAKLTLDITEYEKNIEKAKIGSLSMGNTFGKATAVIGAAIGAATTAVGAFATSAISAGKDFDTAMGQVQATMLKSSDQIQQELGTAVITTSEGVKEFSGNLREFAQFLGENTAFSATQAAEALNYMALAGYDTQESMTMLPNVLNLAAAGAMDLAYASDMVTDMQTALGINAERTAQMVDEMAKAASTGNTSVSQLGEAMLRVGALGAELNGGFITLADGTEVAVDNVQELQIAFTAMANSGIKGAEAGTHMRNMIMKLANPTDKGVEALKNLGMSMDTIYDSAGNMRSLHEVFDALGDAFENVSQKQKLEAISALFNARDLASAEALLSAIESDWDEIGESILDSSGAAADMANIQLDNLQGDMTLFQSALEGAQIAVSDKLTPSLRDFVQFGTKGLSELTSAFKEGGLTGAMDAFGDLLSDGITVVLEKIPQFIEAGSQLVIALIKGLAKNKNKLMQAARDILRAITSTFGKEFPGVKKYLDLLQKAIDGVFGFIERHESLVKGAVLGILEGFLAYKAAVTVFMGIEKAIKAVNTITKVLNGTLAVNPYAIIATTIGVVIGLFSTLYEKERAEVQAHLDLITALSEEQQARSEHAKQSIDELNDIYDANQKVKQSIEEELQPTMDMAEELRNIVDENGRIKDGYEERASVIMGELNEAFGLELEQQGKVISNYDTEMAKLDELIQKKKLEALLDANKEQYAEYMQNQTSLLNDMQAAQEDYNATYKEYKDAVADLVQAQMAYVNVEWWKGAVGKAAAIQDIVDAQNAVYAYEAKLGTLQGQITETTKAYYQAEDYIKNYNEALDASVGKTDDMASAIDNLTNGLMEVGPLDLLEQQVYDTRDAYIELKNAQADGALISQDVIDDALEKFKKAADIFEDAGGDLGKDLDAGIAVGLDESDLGAQAVRKDMQSIHEAARDEVKSHSPSELFKELGIDIDDGLALGIEEQTSVVITKTQNMLKQVEDVFKGIGDKAKLWGKDLMSGFTTGIMGNMASLTSTMTNMASTVKSYIHFSEPDKGPLSDFHTYAPDMMKLFAEGITDNTGLVTDAVSNAFDFKDMIATPEYAPTMDWSATQAPNTSSDSATLQKVVNLLEQIADGGMNIALEGDAADIFTVVARENRIQTRATGYNQLSMIGR